ncbi:uncharacterized protein LOC118191380 [Stegodyphus dumicola]|uniref:uncharacterized protein LOC118191380 n=1 Tax=Stegodyphus dumicola TaxID=202533 RepID=UPI0015AF3E05|nr:uncharacterized protein LOC118191380 [Stegodyphus dumicola]
MNGCSPRLCDHHCAQVCYQYVCPCDYAPSFTPNPTEQRVCCQWEYFYPESGRKYEDTNQDRDKDILTHYFGVHRYWRDIHDPLRFTGVNHIPRWLHTDLSSFDVDYSNILKEREIMGVRNVDPGFYQFRSIRPYNKTNENWLRLIPSPPKLDTQETLPPGKVSVQAMRYGQMPFLS